MKLKPIKEQVIVITGASSGIGLTTARMAAEQGARVVLAARDEESLRRAVDEIRSKGGQATYVIADVSVVEDVRRIADTAVREFGGFDTWVNDAGVIVMGTLDKVPLDDARRLFDTNYWGMVHGSLTAAEHLRSRGGAIINIGSVTSDRAVVLEGHYVASKMAMKGFTDVLRMELEKEGAPIALTLVKPGPTATPIMEHAANYLENAKPVLPPPVYAPETVAKTILHCAERAVREVTVGGGGAMFVAMDKVSKGITDRYMESVIWNQHQIKGQGGDGGTGNLYAPMRGTGRERGQMPRHVFEHSAFTSAVLHPVTTLLGAAALGAGLFLATRMRASSARRRQFPYAPTPAQYGVRRGRLPWTEKMEVEEVW